MAAAADNPLFDWRAKYPDWEVPLRAALEQSLEGIATVLLAHPDDVKVLTSDDVPEWAKQVAATGPFHFTQAMILEAIKCESPLPSTETIALWRSAISKAATKTHLSAVHPVRGGYWLAVLAALAMSQFAAIPADPSPSLVLQLLKETKNYIGHDHEVCEAFERLRQLMTSAAGMDLAGSMLRCVALLAGMYKCPSEAVARSMLPKWGWTLNWSTKSLVQSLPEGDDPPPDSLDAHIVQAIADLEPADDQPADPAAPANPAEQPVAAWPLALATVEDFLGSVDTPWTAALLAAQEGDDSKVYAFLHGYKSALFTAFNSSSSEPLAAYKEVMKGLRSSVAESVTTLMAVGKQAHAQAVVMMVDRGVASALRSVDDSPSTASIISMATDLWAADMRALLARVQPEPAASSSSSSAAWNSAAHAGTADSSRGTGGRRPATADFDETVLDSVATKQVWAALDNLALEGLECRHSQLRQPDQAVSASSAQGRPEVAAGDLVHLRVSQVRDHRSPLKMLLSSRAILAWALREVPVLPLVTTASGIVALSFRKSDCTVALDTLRAADEYASDQAFPLAQILADVAADLQRMRRIQRADSTTPDSIPDAGLDALYRCFCQSPRSYRVDDAAQGNSMSVVPTKAQVWTIFGTALHEAADAASLRFEQMAQYTGTGNRTRVLLLELILMLQCGRWLNLRQAPMQAVAQLLRGLPREISGVASAQARSTDWSAATPAKQLMPWPLMAEILQQFAAPGRPAMISSSAQPPGGQQAKAAGSSRAAQGAASGSSGPQSKRLAKKRAWIDRTYRLIHENDAKQGLAQGKGSEAGNAKKKLRVELSQQEARRRWRAQLHELGVPWGDSEQRGFDLLSVPQQKLIDEFMLQWCAQPSIGPSPDLLPAVLSTFPPCKAESKPPQKDMRQQAATTSHVGAAAALLRRALHAQLFSADHRQKPQYAQEIASMLLQTPGALAATTKERDQSGTPDMQQLKPLARQTLHGSLAPGNHEGRASSNRAGHARRMPGLPRITVHQESAVAEERAQEYTVGSAELSQAPSARPQRVRSSAPSSTAASGSTERIQASGTWARLGSQSRTPQRHLASISNPELVAAIASKGRATSGAVSDTFWAQHLRFCEQCATGTCCPSGQLLQRVVRTGVPLHWGLRLDSNTDRQATTTHRSEGAGASNSSRVEGLRKTVLEQNAAGHICLTSTKVLSDLPQPFLVRSSRWEQNSVGEMYQASREADKQRLVVDFSKTKTNLVDLPFTLRSVHDFAACLRPGDYIGSCDLCSAFYALPLSPESIPLTAFDAIGTVAYYLALPMGWPHSPVWLQWCTELLGDHVRALGYLAHIYMDDLGTRGATPGEAWGALLSMVLLAREAGFHLKLSKVRFPAQELRHLGMVVTTVPTVRVIAPPDRRRELAAVLKQALNSARRGFPSPPGLLEHLVGRTLAYATHSRGELARAGALVVALRARLAGHDKAPLARRDLGTAIDELIRRLDGYSPSPSPLLESRTGIAEPDKPRMIQQAGAVATSTSGRGRRQLQIFGASDASDSVAAAFVVGSQRYTYLGALPSINRVGERGAIRIEVSSAAREFIGAAAHILQAIRRNADCTSIVWYVDNTAALYQLCSFRASSPHAQQFATALADELDQSGITLIPVHLGRDTPPIQFCDALGKAKWLQAAEKAKQLGHRAQFFAWKDTIDLRAKEGDLAQICSRKELAQLPQLGKFLFRDATDAKNDVSATNGAVAAKEAGSARSRDARRVPAGQVEAAGSAEHLQ